MKVEMATLIKKKKHTQVKKNGIRSRERHYNNHLKS